MVQQQLQWQNVCSALRLRARISKAISLGLVTISLISLSFVSTPAGVSAAAGIIPARIIPPIPPPGQISQGPNCPTSYDDYPRYISKFNDGWAGTYPAAINDLGQVAGSFTPVPGQKLKGFVRNVNGTFAPAPWFGPDYDVYLTGINNLGQYVGYAGSIDDPYGFFDSRGNTSHGLAPLAINNLGQVAGYHFPYTYGNWLNYITTSGGFLRDATGQVTDLFTFYPTAINTLGQTAGESFNTGYVRETDGHLTPIDVSVLGANVRTHPVGINDLGQVAGWYEHGGRVRGFVRDAHGHVTRFDVSNQANTHTTGINNLGQVVGWYDNGSDQVHIPFVRDGNGQFNYGWSAPAGPNGITTVEAKGINDLGQVTGIEVAGGVTYGFVTGPVFVEPFAQFSVTRTDIVPSAGAITVFGSFTTCPGRTINPVADPVLVKLYQTGAAPAWASIAIPGGSLQLSAGRYVYQGVLHGVPVTVNLYPHSGGSWDFAVYAAGVSGLPSTNPVTVLLAIGDNTAAATVTATIH
jgi:hypothetical protein